MKKKFRLLFKFSAVVFLIVLIFGISVHHSIAQSRRSEQKNQLHVLRSGVGIWDITGSLKWQNFYTNTINFGLQESSRTVLQVEVRKLSMVNSQLAVGFNAFTSIYMSGFFEAAGLGGIGAGPAARFYLSQSSRWQPYLQGCFVAGYNMALGDALGINDVGGFRYRSDLSGGLGYKVSNAFGLFFEIGPIWEYDESFQLDSRALQVNMGIELFRFR